MHLWVALEFDGPVPPDVPLAGVTEVGTASLTKDLPCCDLGFQGDSSRVRVRVRVSRVRGRLRVGTGVKIQIQISGLDGSGRDGLVRKVDRQRGGLRPVLVHCLTPARHVIVFMFGPGLRDRQVGRREGERERERVPCPKPSIPGASDPATRIRSQHHGTP